jgi:hypothetical protein
MVSYVKQRMSACLALVKMESPLTHILSLFRDGIPPRICAQPKLMELMGSRGWSLGNTVLVGEVAV